MLIRKLLLIGLLTIFIVSCEKNDIVEDRYVIFTSDSSGVFGQVLNGQSSYLYPNIPYKVFSGEIILFDRPYQTNVNIFKVTADVGLYDYFSPNNFHYSLNNQYILTIETK